MSSKLLWNSKFSKEDPQFKDPNKFAVDNLEVIKNAGNNLLELGCGNGRDSVFFAKHLINVTAVDFSENALRLLWKNAEEGRLENIQSVQSSIETFLLNNSQKFDSIYAHLSLHFFDSKYTRIVFDRIKDSLRKGGMFLFKVKSTQDPMFGKGQEIDADMFMLDGHIRHFFSEEYLRRMLTGFKVLKMQHISEGTEAFWEVICQRL
jgi:cyclopropane fatty-acyl-phospholipid synthase-like methyltransferase